MKYLVAIAALAVAGCASSGVGVVEERVERVNVPVPVQCVEPGDIPESVTPLNQRMTQEEWDELQVSQKAGAVGFNALSRLNRETLLDGIGRACSGGEPTPE